MNHNVRTAPHHSRRVAERYCYSGTGMRSGKSNFAGSPRGNGQSLPGHEATHYLPGLEIRYRGSSAIPEEHCLTVVAHAGPQVARALRWRTGRPPSLPRTQMRFALSDALGSTTQELGADAAQLTWESYYPFGGTACWMVRHQCEVRYKTAHHAGKERDASGLSYYGFRYYSPWLGRWLNTDPAGPVDGPNLFAMTGNNPASRTDMLGLITWSERWRAAGAAFLRDGVSTLAGAVARYGVSFGLGAVAGSGPANAVLTAVGATAGAAAGGYAGAGLGSRAADALPETYANNRGVRFILSGGGALGGAVTGAMPSLLGYFTNPGGLNPEAIRQIGSLVYAGVRDTGQQTVAELGPRVAWSGSPSAVGVAASMGPYSVALAGVGALRPHLPQWADGTFATALIEGLDGAGGTLVRGLRSDTRYVDGSNRLSVPDPRGTVHAALMRMNGSTLIQGLDGALAHGGTPANANAAGVVGRMTTLPTEWRTYVGTQVQQGIAEAFHTQRWSGFSGDAATLSAPDDWDPPASTLDPAVDLREVWNLGEDGLRPVGLRRV
ncbi:RHS repeat-associated core domain-containing protein [Pandoraea sp.]|uniref:RHS repeat-associated core domain-containing protein n=1 Tax=Pandoraea sp. TaxID=1883445 RepID=UPI0012000F54|nr:RHS repeat-associated core domain-containing protein [Pandoraea sp.]TAL54695.1 MAG: RHS repeat-associated core domain-containing protein [Pandoraea sp.]TAM18537.1 MAG: RHS repeat-associated core domain-containing protein [Pandoraea sp.]